MNNGQMVSYGQNIHYGQVLTLDQMDRIRSEDKAARMNTKATRMNNKGKARVKQIYDAMRGMVGASEFVDGQRLTMDANGTLANAFELTNVEATVYRTEYTSLNARLTIPVNSEGTPGADFHEYRVLDETAQAKIMNNQLDTKIPMIGMTATRVRSNLVTIAIGYQYSVMELLRAAHLRIPLSAERGRIARDAMERELDNIAFYGSPANEIIGLLNNTEIPRGDTDIGAIGGTEFSTKTGLEIEKSINTCLREITTNTRKIHNADTLLLPVAQWQKLNDFISPDSNLTLRDRIMQSNSAYLKAIIPIDELAGAGTAGSDIMIAYKKEPQSLAIIIPGSLMIEPPEKNGFNWETPMRMVTGGTIVRKPLTLNIKERI